MVMPVCSICPKCGYQFKYGWYTYEGVKCAQSVFGDKPCSGCVEWNNKERKKRKTGK